MNKDIKKPTIVELNEKLGLDDLLIKKNKTLQLEYNHQTNKIKVLICEMKRID